MTHAVYVFAGYGLTTAVLAGYATWIVTRRRSLARALGLDNPPAAPKVGAKISAKVSGSAARPGPVE